MAVRKTASETQADIRFLLRQQYLLEHLQDSARVRTLAKQYGIDPLANYTHAEVAATFRYVKTTGEKAVMVGRQTFHFEPATYRGKPGVRVTCPQAPQWAGGWVSIKDGARDIREYLNNGSLH